MEYDDVEAESLLLTHSSGMKIGSAM